MNTMDEVLERMQIFRQALANFNDALEGSLAEMRTHHDAVDPLWADNARRTYDEHWVPLQEMVQRYLRAQAPDYDSFLVEKIQALEAYLHGR